MSTIPPEKRNVVKKVLLALAALGLVLGVTACGATPSPHPDKQAQQLTQVVRHIKADGHKIDEAPDAASGAKVLNVGWETETEKKKHKSHGKTITVKKNIKIAEVVVVIPGSNCKVELEALLEGDPSAYYADEGRNQYGNEMELPSDFPADHPSPRNLKDYMNQHKGMFSFCIGKPYKASTHPGK